MPSPWVPLSFTTGIGSNGAELKWSVDGMDVGFAFLSPILE
jgi:hypothetical protein